jgi:hypothetical protein
MGYKAEDIYFVMSGKGEVISLHMMLKTDGKEFLGSVGHLKGSREEVQKGWEEASAWWNTTTEPNRKKLWMNSFICKNSVQFVVAMIEKGFKPKRLN